MADRRAHRPTCAQCRLAFARTGTVVSSPCGRTAAKRVLRGGLTAAPAAAHPAPTDRRASKAQRHALTRERSLGVQREFQNTNTSKALRSPGALLLSNVDVAEAETRLQSVVACGVLENLPGLNIARADLVEMWHAILPHMRAAPFDENKKDGLHYKFDNPAYAWGDGYVLYGMISHLRPKQIIEIGSGWSSACMIDAVDHNLDGQCELTFIDPYPKLLHEIIGDAAANVTIIGEPIQSVPLDLFDTLGSGDILFIALDACHAYR